jgi:hypothetical protein
VITEPTIILLAKSDGVSPTQSSERHDRFSTDPYQRRVGPVAGHFLPPETPEAVVQAVREVGSRPERAFLARHPRLYRGRRSGSRDRVLLWRAVGDLRKNLWQASIPIPEFRDQAISGRDGLGRRVAGPRCQQYQRNRHSSLIRRLHGLDEFTGPGTPFRENPECRRKWHIHRVHSFGR